MTIRRLRLVAFLGSLLLVAASVAVTFAALQTQREDALVINLAGRQRMLIQQMTLEVLGTQIGTNRVYREDLDNTAHAYFEATLNALIAGGPAPYTDGMTVTLPPTRSPQILAQLETVRARWDEMHAAIHAVLESDPQSSAFTEGVAAVERLSPVMLAQMDEAVRLYEAESARKVAGVQSIQIGFLAVATVLLTAALALSERWVLAPIARLGSAARRIGEGDLTTSVSVTGPGEISRLARSFDDMRQSLSASREQSADHIQQQAALLKLSWHLIAQLDADAILDQTAGTAREIFSADLVSLMFPDASGENLVLRAGRGWEADLYGVYAVDVATSREGYAFRNVEAVWLEDVQTSTRFPCPRGLRERGIHSSLTAPLNAVLGTFGTLCVHFREQRKFDDHDVRLLSLIANTTAQAFERARQHSFAQERLGRISALHDIDVAISSSLSLQERLDILLEKVTERLRVDAAAVALIDVMTRELVYVARRGLDGEFFQDGLLRVEEGIAGQVAQTGVPVAIPDVRAEPRFVRRPIAERLGIVSYMAVALRVRGEIIGVLELATREPHTFPQEEVDFFVTLAGQAAVALENARLWEHDRERLRILQGIHELAQAFAAMRDMRETLRVITELAARLVNAESCVVTLFDPDKLEVRAAPPGFGVSEAQVTGFVYVADDEAVALWDTARDETFLENDPARLPPRFRALAEGLGARNVLAARMIAHQQSLGILYVANKVGARGFSADDASLLATLANQAVVAVENARLFQTEREQRELAEALRDAATALSATLDFDTVLDHLLGQIAPVVPYDTANVMLLDAPTGRIRVARQRGYEQFGEQVVRDIAALSFDITATVNLRRMVESRRPLVIPDTAADPGWVKVEASAHVRSWAGAPIVVAGQVIAFFSLDKIEPNFYRPQHGERLAAFAGQAALALQNARLFEETGRRVQELALLYDAGLTLNRVIEPRMQLEFLLKLAATALRADAAEFLVFDPARDELRYEFGIGLSADAAEGLRRLRFAAADEATVPGWVATHRLLLNLPDAPSDPRWVVTDPALHSALFVPIAHEKQLRGILGVKSKSGNAFTPQDERLLTLFANQVSVAMNNAQLFEETRHRAEELEALTQVSATLRKAQTREAMLPLLVEKAMQALQADAGALILLEEGALVFAAGHGPAEAMLGLRYPLGDDPLWQVARTGEPIFIPDVAEQSEFTRWEVCRALMAGMTACACVPLKTAEATVGLLHLACRSRREATEGEIRLLTSIAEMAGNALHRAALHEQVARDAVELANAYEATLEGWAHALELRDRETEGHTRRATDLTLRLARAMGVSEEEIIHIRRGALLHDMGKMGVPDTILLKPGPLTDDEWRVMRLHPQFAFDMLSSIVYLRPALDIPYCHHEKWDGSGYPRGLHGENIPIAARIFAVVDVWDALRSDRPYRKGWPEERVREHIQGLAGTHFDPQVAEVFLGLDTSHA